MFPANAFAKPTLHEPHTSRWLWLDYHKRFSANLSIRFPLYSSSFAAICFVQKRSLAMRNEVFVVAKYRHDSKTVSFPTYNRYRRNARKMMEIEDEQKTRKTVRMKCKLNSISSVFIRHEISSTCFPTTIIPWKSLLAFFSRPDVEKLPTCRAILSSSSESTLSTRFPERAYFYAAIFVFAHCHLPPGGWWRKIVRADRSRGKKLKMESKSNSNGCGRFFLLVRFCGVCLWEQEWRFNNENRLTECFSNISARVCGCLLVCQCAFVRCCRRRKTSSKTCWWTWTLAAGNWRIANEGDGEEKRKVHRATMSSMSTRYLRRTSVEYDTIKKATWYSAYKRRMEVEKCGCEGCGCI